jgi:hypothetical protein
MKIIKVTEFYGNSEIRYNKSELDGTFISEGNGFFDDKYNSLPFKSQDKIIEIWYDLVYTKKQNLGKQGIYFIPTLSEAEKYLKEFGCLD